eukprot:CAMPEP_0206249802 /NCGR_PEP_ID=MMETSP0047_2-20121206/21108_1 /ASSEMBLY_ACC=CAM_ASM_000192 /TAXON_ID=195065 /ORGANISM="Chroomonas mesostigmatica_cf, Strain CCMP1168" /LENGTH=36 /DNA_ID= /DNA_START= /DNA_END= /DNA_ORIENTATION=
MFGSGAESTRVSEAERDRGGPPSPPRLLIDPPAPPA